MFLSGHEGKNVDGGGPFSFSDGDGDGDDDDDFRSDEKTLHRDSSNV
jgi:hypothetical protein